MVRVYKPFAPSSNKAATPTLENKEKSPEESKKKDSGGEK